jgi:hypothetical protein
MTDLLPCPFCGSPAEFGSVNEPGCSDHGGHFIQCTNGRCLATTCMRFDCGDDPKPLLVEQWNRRDRTMVVGADIIEKLTRERDEAREERDNLGDSLRNYAKLEGIAQVGWETALRELGEVRAENEILKFAESNADEADTEVQQLKARIRTLELLGTKKEMAALYAMKARAEAAEAALGHERQTIAARAREIAGKYELGSDGCNTFVLLAEWVEARMAETIPEVARLSERARLHPMTEEVYYRDDEPLSEHDQALIDAAWEQHKAVRHGNDTRPRPRSKRRGCA